MQFLFTSTYLVSPLQKFYLLREIDVQTMHHLNAVLLVVSDGNIKISKLRFVKKYAKLIRLFFQ